MAEALAPPSGSLPPLTDTYGAVLISSFIGLGLYGLTCSQTFRYYRLFRKDFAFHKALVPAILITDTFHSVTLIHLCYHYLIDNYYNPLALLQAEWSIQVMPLSTGIVLLLCQSFYARRIWLVDRRFRWIIGIVILLILAGTITGASYYGLTATGFAEFIPHTWLNSVSFGLATATDLILMVLFGAILRGSKTSFKDTRRGLGHSRGLRCRGNALTIPALIASIVSKDTFIYMALSIPTVKIYSNGVLMFLNLRTGLAESVSVLRSNRTPSFSMSNVKRGGRSTAPEVSRHHPSPSVMIDIKMTTDVHEERDTMSGIAEEQGRVERSEAKHSLV